jgi:hypothetical protein
LTHGIDHLGYFIKPDYVSIRHKVVASSHKVVDLILWSQSQNPAGYEQWQAWLRSLNTYFGYFSHGASRRIRDGLVQRLHATPGFKDLVRVTEGCRSLRMCKQNIVQSEQVIRKVDFEIEKKFKAEFKTGYLKIHKRFYGYKKAMDRVKWSIKNWRPCLPVLRCFDGVGTAQLDLASGGCSLSVPGDFRAPAGRSRRRRRGLALTGAKRRRGRSCY